MHEQNYYELLGVDTKASPEKISRHYKNLAYRFHPDRNSSAHPHVFLRVKEAAETLLDPLKRLKYDLQNSFVEWSTDRVAELSELQRQRANQVVDLMQETVSRSRAREEPDGLIILKARYGILPPPYEDDSDSDDSGGDSDDDFGERKTAENQRSECLFVDVTVPLQCMVQDSQMRIPRGVPKSKLDGFYDPITDDHIQRSLRRRRRAQQEQLRALRHRGRSVTIHRGGSGGGATPRGTPRVSPRHSQSHHSSRRSSTVSTSSRRSRTISRSIGAGGRGGGGDGYAEYRSLRKQLEVQYKFHRKLHRVRVGDTEPLTIPLREHCCMNDNTSALQRAADRIRQQGALEKQRRERYESRRFVVVVLAGSICVAAFGAAAFILSSPFVDDARRTLCEYAQRARSASSSPSKSTSRRSGKAVSNSSKAS